MKKILVVTLLLASFMLLAVPPHPAKKSGFQSYQEYNSEVFRPDPTTKNSNMPDSILVLRTQFQDVKFISEPTYPDSIPHDKDYFERYMFHLSCYLQDASHGNFILGEDNYTVVDSVITLPQTMGYYGDDDMQLERVSEFAQATIQVADSFVDFNKYDSFIIFHAGAGQEADINSANPEELFSTFLTRTSLQEGLQPDNDDFPGIQTNDGKVVKELVICPETQWQPDFEPGDTNFKLFGILTYLYCRQMGLPTLFDNVSSNGRGNGIGDFGIMGTGAWNANGNVPPLPCAWSRYYMGWETNNLVEIEYSNTDFELIYPMAADDQIPKLYKINITDKEYFLLENRQQNPDNSTINGFPNFTFKLIPDQDYYPPPNDNVPRFNFMKNSYLGCEWDFFLPGPGYGESPGADNQTVDGSGIFIWHIDENIIKQTFKPKEGINVVNATSAHKGVDLEEADGIQHMDALISMASWGSAYDSYRADNNTYFGKGIDPFTGYTSQPTSDSYYGQSRLEVFDVSPADTLMTFSVNFDDRFKTDYVGENNYPAAVIDFDDDGSKEIFYPMPNGDIYLWKNGQLWQDFATSEPLSEYFAYDQENQTFLLPAKTTNSGYSSLYLLTYGNSYLYLELFTDHTWAAPPVITDNNEKRAILPMNSQDKTKLFCMNSEYSVCDTTELANQLSANLMYKNNQLFYVDELGNFCSKGLDSFSETETVPLIDFPISAQLVSASLVDLTANGQDNLILTTSDSLLYAYQQNGELLADYPVKIPLPAYSLPTFADTDGNGKLETILGGENYFVSIDHLGNYFTPQAQLPAPDSTQSAAGVISADTDDDNIPEVIGNFSKNRLSVWKNNLNNTFKNVLGKTYALNSSSRNFPIYTEYEGIPTVFIAADNGELYKIAMPDLSLSSTGWQSEYANLQRTAVYNQPLPQNQFTSSELFINSETYVYPNPFSSAFNRSIFKGKVMEDHISVRFMLSESAPVKIKVFDITGSIIKQKTITAEAYVAGSMNLNVNKMASGVYCAILKANGKVKKLKFAIEK
jgi:M6 family metalloprotease-like protein